MNLSPACPSHVTVVAALTLVLVASAPGVWAGEPTDGMRDLIATINLVLADPRTEDQPFEKLKAIRPHVDTVFDFREAAILALGREWTRRTAPEREEFVALFADLLERSFVWRLAGKASLGGGLKVRYLGESIAGDTATVDTAIASRDGNDLRLEYRMVRKVDRWMVRDVVMEGVSTMENYRAQFHRIVRDGSWRDLMAQMRARLGTPPGEAQVAAPAPLGPAAAREVAAVVSPSLPVRDVGTLPTRRLRPAAATEPPAPPPLPREIAREPGIAASPRETSVAAPASEPVAAAASSPLPDVSGGVKLAAVRAPAEDPSRPVDPGPTRRAIPPAIYWVQVGAFRNAQTARRVADHVKGKISAVSNEGAPARQPDPLLRVRVGPFKDRGAAVARLRELEALGYQPFLATN